MKNKLIKNTISKVVNNAKSRATTIKGKVVSAPVAKATVKSTPIAKVTKTLSFFDVIISIFNNYSMLKNIYNIIGPKFKIMAPIILVYYMFFLEDTLYFISC